MTVRQYIKKNSPFASEGSVNALFVFLRGRNTCIDPLISDLLIQSCNKDIIPYMQVNISSYISAYTTSKQRIGPKKSVRKQSMSSLRYINMIPEREEERGVLQSNKGISDLNVDMSKVLAFVSDSGATDKITPEQWDKAERVVEKPKEQRRKENYVAMKKSRSEIEESGLPESYSSQRKAATRYIKTKERLEDIVSDIISCTSISSKVGIYPLSRIHCLYDGEDKIFWFTNGYQPYFRHPELAAYGQFVPQTANLAVRIQSSELGSSFQNCEPYLKRKIWKTIYLENRANFQDQTIGIAGDSILYQYRDIREFLKALRENQEDIREEERIIQELNQQIEELKKTKGTAQERAKITRAIKEHAREYRILTEQQEDLKNITIYIRKQGEMRYSHIVDPIQTRIWSQNLFDGKTIIIDGGPGTGKSTTMIHRLAYLTDIYAIDEDEKDKIFKFNLSTSQRKALREAIKLQRDWIFFSPSKLLKDYLAEAMKNAKLKNSYDKVWNWKDYLAFVLQDNYQILGPDSSNAPFRVCYLDGTLFYQNSGIIDEFTKFIENQLREINEQLPNIEAGEKVYAWTAIAMGIKKRIEESENYNLAQFVSLFNSLEAVYYNDCKKLIQEENNALSELAENICKLLDNNPEVKSDIETIFELTSELDEANGEEIELEDISEDEKDERESSGIVESILRKIGLKKDTLIKPSENNRLASELKKWLNDFCYSRVNESADLSDENQLICDTLLPVIGDTFDTQIKKIGELGVFEQFAKYTRGVKSIMLNGIPSRYKKFRSHLIKTKFEGCDLKLLRDVMQRKQGKELHQQEQSLLLGFINTLVKQILTTNSNIKHPYIEAYKEAARPIIGIDEATDFSACDIYAMQSLLSRDFFSMTLCGDKMQRMTPYGIK